MCDTFGVLGKKKIFGKNSDRSPNEIQLVEFIKGYKTKEKYLKTTYIKIPQVKETYSILISRPAWMWGAEMGVNEHGLVIGNEAIFTKGKYNKTGLTGMDLVRLCLERCKSAAEAIELLKYLIKKYKVGGNCGYDHNFYYDNSFMIMDRNNIYILENSKEKIYVKKTMMDNISNCLSLKSDIKENKIFKYFSGSRTRHKLVNEKLKEDLSILDAFSILRQHEGKNYFHGSVKSVCMHAGKLIGDHTTNSMVVELEDNNINIYTTMGSMPCISIYKKINFKNDLINSCNIDYYKKMECIKRKIMFEKITKKFYNIRDDIQKDIINGNIDFESSIKKEEELFNLILNDKKNTKKVSNYWKKKNKKFMEE